MEDGNAMSAAREDGSDKQLSPAEVTLRLVMSNRIANGLSALPQAVEQQLAQISPAALKGVITSSVDPSLMFSMERTFLSALNTAFYIMMLGAGLTTINDHDEVPNNMGKIIIVLGIVFAVISYISHTRRLVALARGERITMSGSLCFLGLLLLITLFTVIAEFGLLVRAPPWNPEPQLYELIVNSVRFVLATPAILPRCNPAAV